MIYLKNSLETAVSVFLPGREVQENCLNEMKKMNFRKQKTRP